MLQNRVVGGATMGGNGSVTPPEEPTPSAGLRRVRAVTFGPYGYLNLAVATIVLALVLCGLALKWPDPLGARWSWIGLAVVAAYATLGRFASSRGAQTDLRYRSGPRTVAYYTQRSAPWAVLGLFLIAFIASLVGLPVLTIALVGVACGVTAGLAPTYFQAPPLPTR
ncbi:hypothetical protein ACFVWR_18055 [Leifsonia sp. NPDC058292]|uniref:hypothetical protein n=1 Tax=Leifsonia sp. NPDC058292 TaxID=3346428 RepID=UPI0036DD42BF